MATIVITPRNTSAPYVLTKTTLTLGPDTLAYVQGTSQEMELENSSGSSVTVTLLGSTSSAALAVVGAGSLPTGGLTINAAAGKAIVVAAGTTQRINLDAVAAYLQGAVTLTSTTAGVFASVIQ
jgi:hypothetical protein